MYRKSIGKTVVYKVSYIGVMMTLLIASAFAGFWPHPIKRMIGINEIKGARVVILSYKNVGGVGISILLWVVSLFGVRKLTVFLMMICQLDDRLRYLGVTFNLKATNWFLVASLVISLAALALFTGADAYFSTYDRFYWDPVLFLYEYMDVFLSWILTLHFFWAVMYCYVSHKLLNEKFKQVLMNIRTQGNKNPVKVIFYQSKGAIARECEFFKNLCYNFLGTC